MDAEKQLLLKLFIGIPINSEIRMHLAQSIGWKEAQILKDFDSSHLIELYFQEQTYIGKFLPSNLIKLNDLKKYEAEVKTQLKHYCPSLKLEKYKIIILSQQFVS